MLKCIRINLYKKKLKYNLKLFKFRKSSQVLSLARSALSLEGSGSPAKGTVGRRRSSKSFLGRGTSATPSPPQGGWPGEQTDTWAAAPTVMIRGQAAREQDKG